jgi:hypothetical protein
MTRVEISKTSTKAFLNNKEERKEKKIYKNIEPTDYLFDLAIDSHPERNLGIYLNQFSNFYWKNVISCNYDYLLVENSDEAETIFSCKILDIKNINIDDLVSIFGDLHHFECEIQNEIIILNDLIYNHLDNYNKYSVRGFVSASYLLSLINILEKIYEKLEEIKTNKKGI